ncbi:MAG TPA: DUF433 domain-containing protein [Gemmataceae bacterium]|nr:DUF433 domain-containing protein [Gemmataceae bacterium]
MKLPEFLERGTLGEIRVKGHRVYLLHIVEDYTGGMSTDAIAEEFDTVSRDVIVRVIAFYLDNKSEVDEYVARCHEEMERNYAAAPKIDLEELKRRREEMRKAEKS